MTFNMSLFFFFSSLYVLSSISVLMINSYRVGLCADYEMMNSAINPYVRRTNQRHLDCPLSLLQSCHSPSLPSMIAVLPVPPLHIPNSLSLLLCACACVCLVQYEMSSLVRCEPQTTPSLLTQQEVCCFNRVVYLAQTDPMSRSGLGVRPERGAPKVHLCSPCLPNAPLLKSLFFWASHENSCETQKKIITQTYKCQNMSSGCICSTQT